MMSHDERKIVELVYNRFIASEEQTWSELDEKLEFIGYMNNEELIKEARVKALEHSLGGLRCEQEHEEGTCFAPFIYEAVTCILKLYADTGNLHERNAYILRYYIAMSEMGIIFV